MMNDLLYDFLYFFVLDFLDDILIHSANLKEHADHLREMLQRLREHRLYAKASKWDWVRMSVDFLGQKIVGGGMTLVEAKLKAVCDWATPKAVKYVQ